MLFSSRVLPVIFTPSPDPFCVFFFLLADTATQSKPRKRKKDKKDKKGEGEGGTHKKPRH